MLVDNDEGISRNISMQEKCSCYHDDKKAQPEIIKVGKLEMKIEKYPIRRGDLRWSSLKWKHGLRYKKLFELHPGQSNGRQSRLVDLARREFQVGSNASWK